MSQHTRKHLIFTRIELFEKQYYPIENKTREEAYGFVKALKNFSLDLSFIRAFGCINNWCFYRTFYAHRPDKLLQAWIKNCIRINYFNKQVCVFDKCDLEFKYVKPIFMVNKPHSSTDQEYLDCQKR